MPTPVPAATEIEEMGIVVNDNALRYIIKNDKLFTRDDKFSRTEYEKFLLKSGLTAPSFEKNISELYDPDTMPKGLKDLHQEIDIIVEKSYQSKPFLNDEEKLKCLFDMYAENSPESERLI